MYRVYPQLVPDGGQEWCGDGEPRPGCLLAGAPDAGAQVGEEWGILSWVWEECRSLIRARYTLMVPDCHTCTMASLSLVTMEKDDQCLLPVSHAMTIWHNYSSFH